ncbi:TlpA disulfide reductase family protein [Adhaeribacter aquaticus]|uniref:TlpA disulfide reductase family protein n=1 Tax=Adhaeribacter aquaticus TaxID=299567 RepID=UPI000412A779|nr:TlpA disulfide reductase family protein [Adhaeribacter aquaticus]
MKYIKFCSFIPVFFTLLFCLTNCQKKDKQLKPGTWRFTLNISNQEIPFLMEVEQTKAGKTIGYLVNGEERILLEEITIAGDSVTIPLHIFDADLKGHINDQENGIKGKWTRYNLDKPFTINFTAKHDQKFRFSQNPKPATKDFNGKWQVLFKYSDGTTEKAIGLFEQKNNYLKGTFLSATGDYRFLDGEVDGDEMKLSTFDGYHAYLFKAKHNSAGELDGKFYFGRDEISLWKGIKNANAQLPSADTLTFFRKGYNKINFKFPDLNGNKVSLTDAKYQGKVIVLQLMGSWCPNCMDETAYLAPFYAKHKNRGLEIIGLAYEQNDDFEKAKVRLGKLKSRYNIQYDILVAGTRDKEAASKTLPMLNKVVAFPTTILIDKKGNVMKIHTGFSGPGTGKLYEEFKQDFESTVNQLLAE